MARCANEGVGCQRGGALIPIVRSRFPQSVTFHRALTAHHCDESVANICVTPNQSAEVFGNSHSAAAAGTSGPVSNVEAPSGSAGQAATTDTSSTTPPGDSSAAAVAGRQQLITDLKRIIYVPVARSAKEPSSV